MTEAQDIGKWGGVHIRERVGELEENAVILHGSATRNSVAEFSQ